MSPDNPVDEVKDQSFPGLLEATGERVKVIIEAAESSAEGILEDAKQEARRYADRARDRLDAVSRERTERVAALTDELNTVGEELIRQAEGLRAQAQTLSAVLSRTAHAIYEDLADQEDQLDGLAPETSAPLGASDFEDEEYLPDEPGELPEDSAGPAFAELPGVDDLRPPKRRPRFGGLFRRGGEAGELGTDEIDAVGEAGEEDADVDVDVDVVRGDIDAPGDIDEDAAPGDVVEEPEEEAAELR